MFSVAAIEWLTVPTVNCLSIFICYLCDTAKIRLNFQSILHKYCLVLAKSHLIKWWKLLSLSAVVMTMRVSSLSVYVICTSVGDKSWLMYCIEICSYLTEQLTIPWEHGCCDSWTSMHRPYPRWHWWWYL